MTTVLTRGTVVIDVEACKGCDLCIDACPPRVLVMTTHDVNTPRLPLPACCSPGCTGCQACAQICPDFVFQVYKYDTPIELDGVERRVVTAGDRAPRAARGLGGDRRRDGRRRVPVLRRLPDDAVHRGARAHGRASCPRVGGVCMNAESELEAVGMAWGAAATGTPRATGSTGQGLSLMQESLAEIVARARPARRAQHGARAGRLLAGDPRRRPRRLPRMPVLAPMDVPEAVELTQLAFHLARRWRNPVLIFGDYYLAHTTQSVDARRASTSARCPADDWALDGSTSGTGRARLVSPLGTGKQRDDRRLRPRRALPRVRAGAPRRCSPASSRWSRPAFVDDADVVVVAFGTPGQVRARRGAPACAPRAPGRLRPPDHAAAVPDRRRRRPRPTARGPSRVYENNQGQMIDDVRLAVLGRAPVALHRRPQPRRLRLRHRARPRRSAPARRGSRRCSS